MARPSNRDERRQQIVEALLRLMSRGSYADATVAAIAREAGLAAGLVHYHFESKRAVLVALVQHLSARLEQRRALRAQKARSAATRLTAFLEAWVETGPDADPDAVLAWVEIGSEAARDAEVRAVYMEPMRRALDELETLVCHALRERGASTRASAFIARTLLVTIEGFFRAGTSTEGLVPSGSAAPTLRRLVSTLLAAEDSDAVDPA